MISDVNQATGSKHQATATASSRAVSGRNAVVLHPSKDCLPRRHRLALCSAEVPLLALDPDIPPARQRVVFTAEAPGMRWLIDGRPLATGASARWLPWPGRRRVTLVDAADRALDEIRLEVRGAGVRSGVHK